MKTLPTRAVVVTRPTDFQALMLRHATREQARFVLESRGQSLDEVYERHVAQDRALHTVLGAVPTHWRRAHVPREALDRFLFEPEDFVLTVGQDGLVANVAKYLRGGQPVAGVSPYPAVLARHAAAKAADLMSAFEGQTLKTESRTLVQASTDDGRALVALNEIYVGHKTHQSSRYVLKLGEQHERHSSSGLIVATGTGATGWASSIARGRNGCPELPAPTSRDLVFLVREAWKSRFTGSELVHGRVAQVAVVAEMDEGGVVFGDGIESDFLPVTYGQTITLSAAKTALELVT